MEAGATGFAELDAAELAAAADVLVPEAQPPRAPLLAGSVRANIGHTGAAAGLAGLLRLASSLGGHCAGPNAQLRALNAHVAGAVGGGRCVLPTQLAAAAATDEHRCASK